MRELTEPELHLVLYSRLNELVQVFPCPFAADNQLEPITVPDPFLLDVPSVVDTSSNEQKALAHYSTFVFREISHFPLHVNKENYNPQLTLVKLFWIDSSRAVYETTFKGPNKAAGGLDQAYEEDNSILRLKPHNPIMKDRDIDDENFVVDDWDESVVVIRAETQLPQAMFKSTHTDPEWTLNWTSIYRLAVRNLETSNSHRLESPPIKLKTMMRNLETGCLENIYKERTSQSM